MYQKVARRLIPILFISYIAAYLDRVNVGFAKLQMQADIPQISDSVFGLGAGIFFLGYFLFEVPSNILMEKVGPRFWIARIMITWGLISTAMIFVNSAWLFYTLRFLLGVAEAGFFPGVILYLTYWFPSKRRGEMVAFFMLAVALTGVIGAPLSGWILHQFGSASGLRGWQMLFLLQGLPSIFIGFAIPWLLTDGVKSAKWLTGDEKQIIERALSAEEIHKKDISLYEVFYHPALILYAVIYFCCVLGLYGTTFWIPQLIKNTGVKDPLYIGLLTTIPNAPRSDAMANVDRRFPERSEFLPSTTIATAPKP